MVLSGGGNSPDKTFFLIFQKFCLSLMYTKQTEALFTLPDKGKNTPPSHKYRTRRHERLDFPTKR